MLQKKQPPLRNHVSYSELKIWNECSYRHKLAYVEQKDHFTSNEFTTFGTAIHAACEELVKDPAIDPYSEFSSVFQEETSNLDSPDLLLLEGMRTQASEILPEILPTLQSEFGKYSVVSVEEELHEPMSINDKIYKKKFKGFIDLVIKTQDEKYHIIDWKTCSWGWDAKKKSDKILAYQLVLYKNFFAKKHNIPLENIETHFALLKRTAKTNRVEFVRVTSGKKRVNNALEFVDRAIKNIDKGFSIKNRLSCRYCPFYNTEECT